MIFSTAIFILEASPIITKLAFVIICDTVNGTLIDEVESENIFNANLKPECMLFSLFNRSRAIPEKRR